MDDARIASRRTAWAWGLLATLGLLGLAFGGTEAGFRNRRRLLEEGTAVRGTVTDRRKVQGKTITYYVTYHFPGPQGEQRNTVAVGPALYNQAPQGTPLTIL